METTIAKIVESAKLLPGNIAIYRFVSGSLNTLYFSNEMHSLFLQTKYNTCKIEELNALELVFEPDRKRVANQIEECIQTNRTTSVTYRIVHNTMGYLWVQSNIDLVSKDAQNNPVILIT